MITFVHGIQSRKIDSPKTGYALKGVHDTFVSGQQQCAKQKQNNEEFLILAQGTRNMMLVRRGSNSTNIRKEFLNE